MAKLFCLDFDLENEQLCDGCSEQAEDLSTGFLLCLQGLCFGDKGCERRQSYLNMQSIIKDACFALAAEMESTENEMMATELRRNAEIIYS